MSLTIKEIAYFALPVTDVPRARNFYEKIIGLTPTLTLEMQPGRWWIEYDVGATTLALSNMIFPVGKTGASVALEVEDVDASIAELQSAGITPTYGPMDSPVCRLCGITDPDGNRIVIHKRKSGASSDAKD